MNARRYNRERQIARIEEKVSKPDYKTWTLRRLINEFPNTWMRKLNRVFEFEWERLYNSIQEYKSLEFDLDPFDKDGQILRVSGFLESNGKRYWVV